MSPMLSLLTSLTHPALAEGPEPVLYMQVQTTAYDQDISEQADPMGYGDPEDDPGMKLRRLRAGARGELDSDWSYDFLMGVSSPYDVLAVSDTDLQILDAAIFWGPGAVEVSAGRQRVPFSRSAMTSSRQLVFQESTLAANHIAPGRDVGLLGKGTFGSVLVQGGVYNGNDGLFGDVDPGLLYVLRTELNLGGEDAHTDVYATWGEVDSFTMGVAANAFFNQQLATNTLAYGGDLVLRTGGLALLMEVDLATITPTNTDVAAPGVLVETQQLGASAQLGYSVGAFEPALRWEYFNDDQATDWSQGDYGDVMMITGGVTSHWVDDRIKVGGGWVHRMEPSKISLANDSAKIWLQMRL